LIYPSDAHFALQGGQLIMARSDKASKSPAAAKTSRPVTLKHLAATLAEEHQLTKRAGEALLRDLVGLITKHLKKGERIRIAGLGILQVRKRAARMGRNPATGEAIKIKASKKVAFRAAKELKVAV
jgi:DNA-binding protein HU-beta